MLETRSRTIPRRSTLRGAGPNRCPSILAPRISALMLSVSRIPCCGKSRPELDEARQHIVSLIEKCNADMLIFGAPDHDISGHSTMSKIVITARPYPISI
jgi:hypothetical protein